MPDVVEVAHRAREIEEERLVVGEVVPRAERRDAQPVGEVARPDPEVLALADRDLADAFHARLAGASVERLPLAGDDPELLKRQIATALESCDMLVTSGGVSMGVYDFTKAAFKEIGAEILFERVKLKPGKPTVFGKVGEKLIFGLPGNPVSVAVTFNLFARPALRAMQGATEKTLPEVSAVSTLNVRASGGRDSYLPAILRSDKNGTMLAEPLKWGGSSDFVAFAQATALIDALKSAMLTANGAAFSPLVSPNGMQVRYFRDADPITYTAHQAKFLFQTTYQAPWGKDPGSGLEKEGAFHDVIVPELVKVFTSTESGHVREILSSSREGGASLNILSGLVAGNFSSYWLGRRPPRHSVVALRLRFAEPPPESLRKVAPMPKLLHHAEVYPSIRKRIESLQIDTPRQWGKMSIDQMLWHVKISAERVFDADG